MTGIIYHNNVEILKCINNHILSCFEEIKTIYLATDENELLRLIKNKTPNFIFTTYDLYNSKVSAEAELIDLVVILQSPQTSLASNYNTIYISTDYSCNAALSYFRSVALTKNSNILKLYVEKHLKTLNFNLKQAGTQYIVDTIIYLYLNKDTLKYDNLQNKIYPYLSHRHNKSINTIKVAISRAFDEALIKHNPQESIYIDLSVVNTPKDLIPELLIQLG